MSAADRAVELAKGERLVVVVGPTASGKTDLAMEVCARIGGEIVSADSVQVYRGFDIGSGKPSLAELERVPHHLVSTHAPGEAVDAAAWAKLAEKAIEDIRGRGRVPVVCGGTFFWVRALVLGLVEAPPGDAAIRERHAAIVEREGRPALHALLARVDPESAQRLHPNDVVRTSRALEVYELSGRTMASWQNEHGFKARRFDTAMIGLEHDMDALTARIRRRAELWLTTGWRDEVRALLEAGHANTRAMGAVGYAEVHAHLRGELPESELLETIVRATRVFARRQRTWLKNAEVTWL